MSTPESQGFAAAYAQLQSSVQQLRQLGTADVDSLVGLVEQATTAHKACRERLDHVRTLIEAKLQEDSPQ